ncbi:MAG TPA: peptidoglycan-binding domain-containing protein [Candidatus Udaeobacter sp.]|nr:peptidoglycan-binding domain-containing protein [Candidatus Udaeobacter sp.]
MKQFRFSAFCLIAALAVSIHTAAGQVTNATVQNVSSRPAPSRAAPAPTVFGVANTASAPHVAPRPAGFVPRTIGQSAPNLLPNYPVVPRSSNPTAASINAQRIRRIDGQEPITIDPATRQRELRTLAAMRERRDFGNENRTLAAINAKPHVITHDPAARPQLETRESPGNLARTKWHNRNDRPSYTDALRRHWHESHDRNWWHDHCDTIVFVIGGYYFLDGTYWYPAWGYDPLQSYYDYDGPIYTYSNLLPDEVIANVQVALQDAGYYSGAITGSLDFEMRAALANFQRDYDLPITGAIDEATVQTLGLN